MVPASMNLYELLINERIRHGGNRELRAQALAAGKKETARGWRLHKLKSADKIDGIHALALTTYQWESEAAEDDDLELYV